jgi:hypothetical protein
VRELLTNLLDHNIISTTDIGERFGDNQDDEDNNENDEDVGDDEVRYQKPYNRDPSTVVDNCDPNVIRYTANNGDRRLVVDDCMTYRALGHGSSP